MITLIQYSGDMDKERNRVKEIYTGFYPDAKLNILLGVDENRKHVWVIRGRINKDDESDQSARLDETYPVENPMVDEEAVANIIKQFVYLDVREIPYTLDDDSQEAIMIVDKMKVSDLERMINMLQAVLDKSKGE